MWIEHRRHDFDPAIKVTRHPIGRSDENLLFASVGKMKDATELKHTADNAAHVNRLRQTRNAGSQHAGTAHNEINLHTGLRGAIQRVDRVEVSQTIYLRGNPSRPAGLSMFPLALDQIQHSFAKVNGRNQQPLVLFLQREAGQEIEKIRRVLTDIRITLYQAKVGV